MGNSNSDLLYDFDQSIDIVNDGEEVFVERKAEGVYRNGLYVYPSGKTKTFIAQCSVQPASGDTILKVPENQRDKQILTVFSDFKFEKNDTMTRDNKNYKIEIVSDWNVYTESVAVLIDVGS